MIPDICPWARRDIQKKTPTKRTRIKMVGSHWPRKPTVGVLYLKFVGTSCCITLTSAGGGGVPPFTV
jgi:hypothetical protein